jgi:hypothetical protein
MKLFFYLHDWPKFEIIKGEVPYGSAEYYGLCAVGGLLSCGLTHTAVVPLDIVKCRIQVDAAVRHFLNENISI